MYTFSTWIIFIASFFALLLIFLVLFLIYRRYSQSEQRSYSQNCTAVVGDIVL